MDNQIARQAMEALARGDKIGAIKLIRQAGGGSLTDAVKAIEALGAQQARSGSQALRHAAMDVRGGEAHAKSVRQAQMAHHRKPTVEMGDKPGSVRWVMIFLAAVALAVWWGLS